MVAFLLVGCDEYNKNKAREDSLTQKANKLTYIQVGDTMNVDYFREILDVSYSNEWTTTFIHSGYWDYTYITINNKTKVVELIRIK